ncbi:DUF6084 family protein [Paludisphaera borealis]|uniref:Uncharacterized protein n=1 Tax=Paludisphaera borealis TaxID=1387353 RepID=A0A1U7CVK9_9BACT|nr:DUF6084 family protein [Paludisphaera borealis]APW62961.1 hypothetical protein BSF38_04517 [Paludisphaera borealis]
MPDLNFQVEGVEPQKFAAEPLLLFKLRVSEALNNGLAPTPVHTVALRCQVRIEPGRRTYQAAERERLLGLFGAPERWGQTLKPMLWSHVCVVVPSFEGEVVVDLPIPCSFDFSLAATRYFSALDGGDLPLGFLFSGTIFFATEEGDLQVRPIAWDKEASFRLPASTWRELMDVFHPNTAWLSIRRDVFDRLDRYKTEQGMPTWERALERLLATAEEGATP